jgi:3-oxoacyl-[acyl-carrier protein] reductase
MKTLSVKGGIYPRKYSSKCCLFIITGASRGIEKELQKFCKHGANGLYIQFISESALALENELNALGIKAKGYQSNAADFDEAQTMVDAVLADFERLI